MLGALVAVLTAAKRDPQVGDGEFVAGLLVVSMLTTVLPMMAYYALGRTLVARPIVLGVTWLVSLVPLYLYLVVCTLAVAGLVSCPPGAYECPV